MLVSTSYFLNGIIYSINFQNLVFQLLVVVDHMVCFRFSY